MVRRSRRVKRRSSRIDFRPAVVLLLLVTLVYAPWRHQVVDTLGAWIFPRVVASPPLAMAGGDPYIRALMRTISASEANDPQPYSLLYGRRRIADLSHHPDDCVPIASGPYRGDCTTAAGRYQLLSTTWAEKVARYGVVEGFPSFTPVNQDAVVYAWLRDPDAWNMDLESHLRAGEIQPVLAALSSTWTSLGQGIEPNVWTPWLPMLYRYFLRQELAQSTASLRAEW